MPTLPVELWWDILRLAVHTPGIFDTQWDYSPDFLMWAGWETPDPKSSYLDSFQTKLSVCLVSKSWREIGVELLYEHLLLTNGAVYSGVLSKLVAVFEQHANQSGYGRSTKRLDIQMEACSKAFDPWFPPLLRLLELCYNVRILNVSFHFQEAYNEKQSQLFSLLQNRFSHSLRRMQFGVYSPYVFVYFPDVPLRTLALSTEFCPTIATPPAITTVDTFYLDLDYPPPPPWRFPALRHLTVSHITNGELPSLLLFMTNHGPQLHSLHLTANEDAFFVFLPQLLAPATSLRSLVFSPRHVELPPPESSFPSITHIAFQPYLFPETSDMEVFISGTVFPGLQCVRFLSVSNPLWNFEHKDSWMSVLEAGFKRNIRFEDYKGQLIQIRTSLT